jgi:hypothetical protein
MLAPGTKSRPWSPKWHQSAPAISGHRAHQGAFRRISLEGAPGTVAAFARTVSAGQRIGEGLIVTVVSFAAIIA